MSRATQIYAHMEMCLCCISKTTEHVVIWAREIRKKGYNRLKIAIVHIYVLLAYGTLYVKISHK